MFYYLSLHALGLSSWIFYPSAALALDFALDLPFEAAGDGQSVPLPSFIRTLLALATWGRPGGICVILPQVGELDITIAVMAALRGLGRDEGERHRRSSTPHSPTGRVRVCPDGFVYELGPSGTEYGRQGVWLNFIDTGRRRTKGRFFLPESEYWRIEATDRVRPVSKMRSEWSPPQETMLDMLSRTSTRGSFAGLQNRYLLVSSAARFEECLPRVGIVPAKRQGTEAGTIEHSFPWGAIRADGSTEIEHPRSARDEPLIAVTRDFGLLQKACDAAESASKVIISPWLDGCLDNLDIANRLMERHRFVQLVPGRRRGDAQALLDAGWTVWEPTTQQLVSDGTDRRSGIPDMDAIVDAARNESGGSLRVLSEECLLLRSALESLQEFSWKVSQQAQIEPGVEELEREAWHLFHEAGSMLAAPSSDELAARRSGLRRITGMATQFTYMIGDAAVAALAKFAECLDHFLGDTARAGQTPKAALVKSLQPESMPRQSGLVIASGTLRSKSALEEFVYLSGLPIEVVTARELRRRRGTVPETLGICSVYPGDAFASVFDPWPARNVALIGYQHEIETYRARLLARTKKRSLFRRQETDVLRLSDPQATMTVQENIESDAPTENTKWPEIARPHRETARVRPQLIPGADEDTSRLARLCQFKGRSWSAFTEGFEVPVIEKTDAAMLGRPALRSTDELHRGDRLLLREASERDIIRSLAESIAGEKAYASRLHDAQHWKRELRQRERTGTNVVKLLREHGLKRDPATIRYWLHSDVNIGPRSADDLAVIAEALGSDPGGNQWRQCSAAIRDVRGWHLSAGMRLTEIVVQQCGVLDIETVDHEVPIQTPLGLVWLVEVFEFDSNFENWSYMEVNRLRWLRPGDRDHALGHELAATLENLGL